ncbi:MAG: sulfotransferase domain-containing protein [Melioribacteraceae bacterium]|nr:sulfotransferase domain-containing protein [Melioribacteraceae bacterium]MCF8266282.1 sulfotransferase domain-containing protein [Melioribacteraceae bacterium]
MNNILFHIGYHKTATSWMQNELFISKSKNFVPVSKNKKGKSTLATDFIYDKEGYLLSSFDNNEKTILKNFEEISQNFMNGGNRIPVISHERLSGNPHSSGFDSYVIAQRIQKSFPNSKILIVIREQTSWILSNYFQYLSTGGTHSLQKYLNIKYDGKRPGFSPSHIKYHFLIQGYYDRFGENNVLVIPYELLDSDKTAFLKTLGDFLETDLSNENPNFDKRINAKRDHFLNYKLRILNPFIFSSSLNNNSGLHNKNRESIILGVKKSIALCVPKRKNESIKSRLRNEIKEWTGDRFDLSNQITQDLIKVNLEKFDYRTTTNKP